MIAKNRAHLVFIVAIIIFAILVLHLCGIGPFTNITGKHENMSVENTTVFQDKNLSIALAPLDIRNGVLDFSGRNGLFINKYEFDPGRQDLVILYAYDISNMSRIESLQGSRVGNYSIRVVRDNEYETRRSEVKSYIAELIKNPDYQIATTSMVSDRISDEPGDYVELWVYRTTPENKKLDNTMIRGWKILVYTVAPMPTETKNSSVKTFPK
jgi:hypothetical protein